LSCSSLELLLIMLRIILKLFGFTFSEKRRRLSYILKLIHFLFIAQNCFYCCIIWKYNITGHSVTLTLGFCQFILESFLVLLLFFKLCHSEQIWKDEVHLKPFSLLWWNYNLFLITVLLSVSYTLIAEVEFYNIAYSSM